jgi:transcriptional regulator with XRE-family HTH domain
MKSVKRIRPQQRPSGTGPLAAIRLKRGLSRREVAERMKAASGLAFHPNAIGLLESGRVGTRLEVLTALAKALGVKEQVVIDAIKACQQEFRRRSEAA